MKDVNVRISTRLSVIIGAVILLIFAGLIAFAYKEMSSMRRDLYAVRADYYNINKINESGINEYSPVDIDILEQSVKELRAPDMNVTYDYKAAESDPYFNFTPQQIREVKIKVTNKQDNIVSMSSYNFGYVNSNSQVIRSIDVHPDDNSNQTSTPGFPTELAKGGSAEIFVYFNDTGQQIDKVIYLQ